MALDRVHVRRGDQLHRLIPRGPHETTLAPLTTIQPGLLGIIDDLGPRIHRIAQPRPGLAKHGQQAPAHVRVLQAQRRVRVPRERRSPRAATWLVLRHLRTGRWIVNRLGLPRNQPLLHVHVPGARARAVHAVRRAHHLVVRPTVPVGALPIAIFGHQLAPTLRIHRTTAQEPMCLKQRIGTLSHAASSPLT